MVFLKLQPISTSPMLLLRLQKGTGTYPGASQEPEPVISTREGLFNDSRTACSAGHISFRTLQVHVAPRQTGEAMMMFHLRGA